LRLESWVKKSFELHLLRGEKPQNPFQRLRLLRDEPRYPCVAPGNDDFLAAFRRCNQF